MPDILLDIAEIEHRIGIVRANLRELVEQAAGYSGAADEDLTSRRIAEQEAELERLTMQREGILRQSREHEQQSKTSVAPMSSTTRGSPETLPVGISKSKE